MGDLVRFVDSIVASPTVRLDLNDEVKWSVKNFSAPPPRLRRAVSQNAMGDGIFVSSSQYDARVVTIELDLITSGGSAQDDNATELQKLARELDRPDNFLMYQPTGATKPVFFRTMRSDISQIELLTGAKAFRRPTIELLAEPFALGLREMLGPYTVNNDPAAGSNGLFFDVTGVIGDTESPAVFIDRTAYRSRAYLAVRQHGTPSNLTFRAQAEASSLGTDTTNPGGGPDAAMSGTGTNNFVRTSFATVATMTARVTANGSFGGATADARGRYRVFAVVRRSDATSDMQVSATFNGVASATLTLPKTTARQILDFGVFGYLTDVPERFGGYVPSTLGGSAGTSVTLSAARSSGAGTLDWDFAVILPADEATLIYGSGAATDSTGADALLDGASAKYVYFGNGGDPWVAGDIFTASTAGQTGSCPTVIPNQTNRMYSLFLADNGTYKGMDKAATGSIEVHYWPRYLFVRPSAT